MMDIHKVADIINIPLVHWPGNCATIAHALIEHNLVVGTEVRGFWHGPIADSSVFRRRPFTQHTWIEDYNGNIVDPTRYVFEAETPYIWQGDYSEGFYDKGGNMLKEALLRPCPKYDVNEREVTLSLNKIEYAYVDEWVNGEGFSCLDGYIVTVPMAIWLANLPLQKLGLIAKPLYTALTAVNLKAAIPIDNYRMAMNNELHSQF